MTLVRRPEEADSCFWKSSGSRNWSMAMNNGNNDFVVLSNGSIATSATSASPLTPCDGDPAAQQLTPKEAPRTKVSPNGCLQVNGTVKSSFLPLDNQRTPQMLSLCCHPCPYHHPLTTHDSHQECHPEAGPAAPPALASCCMQPHSEYSASLCPNHSPVYQTTCCLQPSPSFCLHHPWPDHFQHQPVPQHIANISPSRPFKLPKSYAALIADWPVVVLGMCTVFIVVCALVGVLVPELPDFSDPLLIRSHPRFGDLCQRTTAASCCPSWTLGNYIAILNNRSSCQKIVERDVSHTLKLLRTCAKHYQNGTLEPDCWDMAARRKDQLKCTNVPRKCTKYNAVYQILHYLVDKDFMAPKTADYRPALKYSMLFSPTEKGESMMNIYLDNFENWNASDGVTTVTGIEFGIKHSLFQDYLLMDTVYPAIAIVIVLSVMCVYTKSMFITLMTMFAIISSLIVSYFLYRVVFNFEFFPFMNLTALIILVGIGADDAFVLCDVWNYTKFDKPHAETSETVSITLQHAALSMFVTSFTTAAAFYANYVSNITAIRCFGVYAGTAILVNYVLMVTWLPAVVVLHERYLLNIFSCFKKPQQQIYDNKSCWTVACQKCHKVLFAISEASRIFFEKVLPCIVIKFRYLWLVWFLALTVGGAYIVCINPKMKLPSLELSEFQVFRSSHPFERYDAEYKKLFMFERVHHGEELHMPITVIWGVSPEDNGNPLNPKSKGKLTLDSGFNIASPASQVWILQFCQKLRNQTFFHQTDEQDFTSCFIETFKQWMENQDCDEPTLYPCCSHWSFPYKQEIFELCIKRAIMELERSTGYHLDSKTPGPRFDINDTIRAVVLEFQSTYLFTLAYEKMHQFYKEVDSWISNELSSAPEGLSHGWFVSNLEFYDLQDSLSDGTLIAMGLSVAVAFSVMLLTTWNIIISLYAIISIAGTIFVTVGSLVLLGWELNVLESVTISVAVGLSVDFAVHYGVAYRLAPDADREGKVIFSLSRMGSAIAMAALTTFVAGAMMMPSTVLAYTQLGTFMMLIMCISWAFATFFFQCMCRCLGPQGTCGQIPLPKKLQCSAFSHTLSTSPGDKGQSKTHTVNAYHLDPRGQKAEMEHEFYELEPLAAHSCMASEKTTYEETHICSEFFSSQAKKLGMPVHTTYNSELNQSTKNEASSALLQPCLEQHTMCHFFSLNQRCSCPNAYQPLKYGLPSCQQMGDCLCHQCAPTASSFMHVQNGLAPLKAAHQAPEGFVHPIPHIHHCPCLQGRVKPPGMQNSLPRSFFHHPGQHIQAQEKLGKTSVHSLQSLEEQLPKMAEMSSLVCRSAGASHKACCAPETHQRGLCKNRDIGNVEGSGGAANKDSSSVSPTDKAERQVEPGLSQTDVIVNSEHLSQNEPQFIFNHLMGEAGYRSCPNNPQNRGRIVRVKCSSVDCQIPNIEANVPAVLTHSELSGESLLIKTL
ncbi:protein dispatched homolog 1 isoform X3 [Globicephala melas]|uniref:protein dispatched homolog 1 isoform X3 n=1 Tax=Globicephala melas TaxID=9731 RepID=UPI00293D3120|nr:protein dispatched homolog 1 isoform X3 [Globicephala melas]